MAKLRIFGSLVSDIINTNLCMYCGACIASCPIDVLFLSEDSKPTIKGPCALCQVCYYSCPRVELPLDDIEKSLFGRARRPEEEALGIYRGAYSARATDQEIWQVCQDGGAVTALLKHAFDIDLIDCAIVSGIDEQWRPVPVVITDPKDLLAASGSKYTPGGSIKGVADAAEANPDWRIAMVGLPCEMQGVRRMHSSWLGTPRVAENLVLTIGLFCSSIFDYNRFINEYVQKKHGVDATGITRISIKKNILSVFTRGDEVLTAPISEISEFTREACKACNDYTAELSDISIGGVGSRLGWSTVMVRTEAGEKLYRSAIESKVLESVPISDVKPGLGVVIKLSEKKKKRNTPYIVRSIETNPPSQKPA